MKINLIDAGVDLILATSCMIISIINIFIQSDFIKGFTEGVDTAIIISCLVKIFILYKQMKGEYNER